LSRCEAAEWRAIVSRAKQSRALPVLDCVFTILVPQWSQARRGRKQGRLRILQAAFAEKLCVWFGFRGGNITPRPWPFP
jgi:hypothetical protein